MRPFFILLIFLSSQVAFTQWNPNAGLIKPLTANAKIEASSGTNVNAIRDNNMETYWESDSPLPSNYITRKDLNVFLDRKKYSTNNNQNIFNNAFDGITSSKTMVDEGSLEIKFRIHLFCFLLYRCLVLVNKGNI